MKMLTTDKHTDCGQTLIRTANLSLRLRGAISMTKLCLLQLTSYLISLLLSSKISIVQLILVP